MTSLPARPIPVGPSIYISDQRSRAIALAAINDHDCQQLPDELAALLCYLASWTRPHMVLEIGGWNAGSAWAWHQLPSAPRVLTVTLPDSPMAQRGYDPPDWHHVIYGDSTAPEVVQLVQRALANHAPQLVFIDGSHHYDVARQDWLNYGKLVTPGGLVAFHDINDFPNHPDLQVHRLWAELAASYRTTELVSRPGQDCGTGILWPWQPLTSRRF